MSITFQHRTYTKGDKTAILSVSENLALTTINEESKECASEKEGHIKLRTLGYKKTDEVVEESFISEEDHAPVAPVPAKKYVKGTPEHKAHKATKKPINGHPTSVKEDAELDEAHKFINVATSKKVISDAERVLKDNPNMMYGSKAGYKALITIHKKHLEKAQEVKEDLDEATSPTAGTRLVKKYGDDANRAEVRYNPDWQEYSVHHYKDGKHMGEGPVSYHGDDKQDAHDTAKHEADKRATVKEELEEAHKIGDKVLIHKGSDAGTVGHIGEIRDGLFKGAPKTYTVDYSVPGKETRQSVQVKREHIKAVKEDTQLDEHIGMDYGRHHKEEFKNQAKAMGYKIHTPVVDHKGDVNNGHYLIAKDKQGNHKGDFHDSYGGTLHGQGHWQSEVAKRSTVKEDADQLDELKKSTLASYTQKAASSMANAAFGQGQASAQYKEPQEKDVKLFSKRLKGIGTATAKLAEARGDADELWDKADEHKKLANANKDNKEKFHSHMYKHHELIARYHSDLGQHNAAERHDKKADDHYNKAAGFGVDEAVIDPKDTRNPDIPTYLRKQQGQKPLSYAEVKARSTKNVDTYRKRAGVLEDTEELEEGMKDITPQDAHDIIKHHGGSQDFFSLHSGARSQLHDLAHEYGVKAPASGKSVARHFWDRLHSKASKLKESNEIFPELASIVESNTGSSVMFKNGETSNVSPDHANALINLHGMLSDENKQKLAEYAHHSMGNFSKVVDWALTKIK